MQKRTDNQLTLDHLSHGRLILYVGLGMASDVDFAHFGEVTDNRQRPRNSTRQSKS